MIKNKFRYDINGLRAYAVALVVLFHFQILGFSAGFIGVDIFFVISGYLMTKIIIDQLLQDKFSIWKFYLARGIRILPALLTLTVVVASVGWFLLIPEEYKSYGKHAASSITFLSNIIYWRESSDYFSAAAHDKILLHTWSLSVEWQFYIILPIILLIIGKIKNRNILNLAVLFGFLISLFLSYKVSENSQTTAFYMIPTRAWEMLAGGLVYAYLSQISLSSVIRKCIEIFGFGLILISLLVFETETLWPSINAILPVLGSMMILMSNCNESIFTKPKIFQFTGDASYSIYLWHWPIVFFITYMGYKNNIFVLAAGIVFSLILGWVSYKYIETPTRRYLSTVSIAKGYLILISIVIVLSVVFSLIFIKNGFPQRASKEYQSKTKHIVMPLPMNNWCFYSVDSISKLPIGAGVLDCKVGVKESPISKSVLLFGDSFGGHSIPFWDNVGKSNNLTVQAITTNWCYPSLNDEYTGSKSSRAFEQCKFNRNYLKQNLIKYDAYVFAGHWKQVASDPKHLKALDELLKETSLTGKPVLLIASPTSFEENLGGLFKRSVWIGQNFDIKQHNNTAYDKATVLANDRVRQLASKYHNVIFLEREDLYPPTNMTNDNYPISLDGSHLSIKGSIESAEYFKNTEKFKEVSKIFR
ncbi:acyltransferase family protein [Acinetobacter baumannii]|nr:acyltransferase [Acinetobacter baumannii]EKU0960331.1 acyltransferase [Acinetobacter baumannii]ELB0118191.1 acyltransferase [Acinetobacter baumannii]